MDSHAHPQTERKVSDDRIDFLITIAQALGTYGTSAHRLEDALGMCAERLDLKANIFSTPTSVFISFETDEFRSTVLSRIIPGDVQLAKLVKLDELIDLVSRGIITPHEGAVKTEAVLSEPSPYPTWLEVLCFGIVSGNACVFLGGGTAEIGVTAIIGWTIGIMIQLAGKNREFARLIEFGSGVIAATIAWGAGSIIGPYNAPLAVLAGLIILLPGLTITVSMSELATRNIVSGSARLIGGLMVLLIIGFGVAVGTGIAHKLLPNFDPIEAAQIPWWSVPISVLIAAVCFVVLFRARLQDVWMMIFAAFIAVYASQLGSSLMGNQLGVAFAAACVGVASNMYARTTQRPAAILTLPGLLILVPGSVGFRSLTAFLDADTLGGIQTATSVFFIGVSIVVGLLLANVIVQPRKAL
jgi:uncharacterized membrane protein YjjP (DUF1212 family)